jgi:hypothetical protein
MHKTFSYSYLKHAHKQAYLRQSIQLTGLNVPSFNLCVENLVKIHGKFSRKLTVDGFEPFKVDSFGSFSCLNLSTRYFTSRKDDPQNPAVPFSPAVDPKGILASMSTTTYFHGEDNQVLYYSAMPDPSRSSAYR